MKKLFSKINDALIKHFGVPERNQEYSDPLDVLIGTILSQNTTDRNSWQAYQNLKEKFPEWEQVLSLTPQELAQVIKSAGLINQKANAILDVLKEIKIKNGELNLDFIKDLSDDEILDYLTSFKGVGVKTASCVLLFSLKRNFCPVDTHVNRIINRVGGVKSAAPDKTFALIRKHIPENQGHSFHTNLLLLGRQYCRPQKPDCAACPIEKLCKYKEKEFTNLNKYKFNDFLLLEKL
ncbi:MAG: endonuclease III [Ignavibacteriaceae bacterium]|nr:endonuclease III [Ignavibacteriaceae bacterium]